LEQKIETANYDDEVLRTLGFMKERQAQLTKVKENDGVEET